MLLKRRVESQLSVEEEGDASEVRQIDSRRRERDEDRSRFRCRLPRDRDLRLLSAKETTAVRKLWEMYLLKGQFTY